MKKNSNSPKAVVRSPKSVVCSLKSVVQIYTGDGKGKTTSAIGLALRSVGAGKKVAIVQFMKDGRSSEIKAIKKYKLPIEIFSYSAGFFKILGDKKPIKEHVKKAEKALKKTEEIIKSGKFNLIILDEINVAISLHLLDVNKVVEIISMSKNRSLKSVDRKLVVDIVLTGRNAHPKLKEIADLISIIQKQKHYFDKGVKARKGIEF